MNCSNCGKELPEGSRFCSACGTALGSVDSNADFRSGQGKKKSGCMIALLIAGAAAVLVIPVIGIVAAIAIPNLLNAIDRGKQKRTIVDLRAVAAAIESYSVDRGHYPEARDIDALRSILEPEHDRRLPTTDGWAQRLVIQSDAGGYRLYSLGKDGVPDGCDGGAMSTFAADICVQNGQLTQWPEGIEPL